MFSLKMRLESRQNLEIMYALNIITMYSSLGECNFKHFPWLIESLVSLMNESIQGFIDDQAPVSPEIHLTYKQLYQITSQMSTTMTPTQVRQYDLHEQRAIAIGQILRNCSFLPENASIFAVHPGVLGIIYNTSNLPISAEIMTAYTTYDAFMPVSYTLEHRKNALVLLSNIASQTKLPSQSFTDLIISMLSDFIPHTMFKYSACETLAKLLINESNSPVFHSLRILEIFSVVIESLPSTLVRSSTYEELAYYEFAFIALLKLSQLGTPGTQRELLVNFGRRLFCFCIYDVNREMDTMRERAMQVLVICSGTNRSPGHLLKPEFVHECEEFAIRIVMTYREPGISWMASLAAKFLANLNN